MVGRAGGYNVTVGRKISSMDGGGGGKASHRKGGAASGCLNFPDIHTSAINHAS